MIFKAISFSSGFAFTQLAVAVFPRGRCTRRRSPTPPRMSGAEMRGHVTLSMARSPEGLFAIRAGEGTLAGVKAGVNLTGQKGALPRWREGGRTDDINN